MNEREVRRTKEEVEEKERRGKGTRTEDPLAPLKPEHISGEEKRFYGTPGIPRAAHTDASRSGRTGNTNGVYFCRVAAAVAGQKACGFYPAPLSVSLDSTFFPFVLASLTRLPTAALFTPCASFFAATSLLPRSVLVVFAPLSLFPHPSFTLSLSLSPRGNRSVELALFPSFSHPAKLATILPCPAFLVSLSRPAVPTTAEAIEHTSDEGRTIPPSALDKDREKERGERRKP